MPQTKTQKVSLFCITGIVHSHLITGTGNGRSPTKCPVRRQLAALEGYPAEGHMLIQKQIGLQKEIQYFPQRPWLLLPLFCCCWIPSVTEKHEFPERLKTRGPEAVSPIQTWRNSQGYTTNLNFRWAKGKNLLALLLMRTGLRGRLWL